MMNIERIQDLKRRLAECTDFGVFWLFYFDNYAENNEFLNLGGPMPAKEAKQVLTAIARRILGVTSAKLRTATVIEVPEFELIHGSCMLKNKVLCILFFTDLDMGMAALSDLTGEGQTIYGRFSIASAKANATVN